MAKSYCTYIMTNRRGGTLYVGITNDLIRRVHDHRSGAVDGFTKRYNLHSLVWFEIHDSPDQAIRREKRLKKWPRQWKINVIEARNPEWCDLWDEVCGVS